MRALKICFALLAGMLGGGELRAQEPSAAQAPPQIQELVRLLQDPAVRSWLDAARAASPAPPAAQQPAGSAPPGGSGDGVSAEVSHRLERARDHLAAVIGAVPQLPNEFVAAVRRVRGDAQDHPRVLLLLASFVLLGFGTEFLFKRSSRRIQEFVDGKPTATISERLKAVGLRFALAVAGVAAFAIGSLGAFLVLEWPPLLKQLVVGYLLAVIAVRFALMLLEVALVPPRDGLPEPERLRILPIPSEHAVFWKRSLGLFLGFFAIGWTTVQLMGPLGFSLPSRYAVAYAFGIGLLAIGLAALWGRPPSEASGGERALVERTSYKSALTVYGVVLYLIWVAGLLGLFWLAAFAVLLPAAISLGKRAVAHLMRPAEAETEPSVGRNIREVFIDRALRFALILAAVLWLAHVLNVDLIALTSHDTGATRLVRGILTAIVVLLLADLLWQVARAAIDAKLAERDTPTTAGTPEGIKAARLRTLLPIFRYMLLALIAVMAVLTALAAVGVEIAPLIAGAGVFGVAIGFGSQTLVRDVISGIFYLLDDAFRVGEYIQSGNFKGTVESFSLRSVKLRHHRGPLYTVPFGQLGAVQNMSRDWVIDKLTVSVAYDTDIEKARKLIKKIGQDLAADPAYADKIIEPMKMQGVVRFGDYAIELGIKMMTKPGEQFTIRRKALARIKQAFDETGIKFPFPTVQIAGGSEEAAAARHVLPATPDEGVRAA